MITDSVSDKESDDDTEIKQSKPSQSWKTNLLNTNERDNDDELGKALSSQVDGKKMMSYSGFSITDYSSDGEVNKDTEIHQPKLSFLITDLINERDNENGYKQGSKKPDETEKCEKFGEKSEENVNAEEKKRKGKNIIRFTKIDFVNLVSDFEADDSDVIIDDTFGVFNNGYSFLTSTRTEEIHSSQSDAAQFLSAIEETELALSSFYAKMQLKLTELKKIATNGLLSVPVVEMKGSDIK